MNSPQQNNPVKSSVDSGERNTAHWWIWGAFLLAFVVFLLRPVFLLAPEMQFFEYVPTREPIGLDLEQMLGYSRVWITGEGSPYYEGRNPYPPVAVLAFSPLVHLDSGSVYEALTILSLACYAALVWFLPRRIVPTAGIAPTLVLMFVTGLVSYGLQFELERGQFNVIAATLTLWAVWLHLERPRLRWLAYCLFFTSVQLKLYPLIFGVLLIDSTRSWRANLKTLVLVGAVTAAGFLALGTRVLQDWLLALRMHADQPVLWVGNHSISSFVGLVIQYLSRHGGGWLAPQSTAIEILFAAVILGCLGILMVLSSRRKLSGVDPYLLVGCTIAGLTIPAVSNDYTLAVLTAPVAILLLRESYAELDPSITRRAVRNALVGGLSLAYASTLFSFTNRPHMLANVFPALLVIMLAATALSALESRAAPAPMQSDVAQTGSAA